MSPAPRRKRRPKPVTPRDVALQVLVGVQVRGAYGDKLAESLADKFAIAPVDRGLLNELVKGALKRRGTLDAVVRSFLHTDFDALPPWIQNALRLGAYQRMYLDRIPAHAAVSETVALARKYGHPGTAGLVNSVLRRMYESSDEELHAVLDRIPDPLDKLAAVSSHPRWLLERWSERFSADELRRLTESNNRAARVGLRANRLKLDADELVRRLEREGLRVTRGEWSRSTVWIEGEVDLGALAVLRGGFATVQDESETLVGELVAPRPGTRALDLCAAPGGKTGHLAESMGDRGEVVAVEKNPARAEVLRGTIARLGYRSVRVLQGDARFQEWDEPFHRVLVDAPCTGLGVLARRADARWRKKPEHLARMAAVQRELLEAGGRAVRRGGALVYSVCSFEPEETEGVITWFLERHPEFRRVSASDWVPDAIVSPQGALTCLPHVHGTDGAYAVRLEHVESFGPDQEPDTK